MVLGKRSDGQTSAYVYNALGARVQNIQVRENQNAGYQNSDLVDGSHGTDYRDFLSDGRADGQRTWETEVGTTVQNDYETVTKNYVVDYLSIAFRDILVTEDGSFTQRYVYDQDGTRISAEYGYADGTERGTTNADGEYGENLRSDIAVNEVGKVWFRTSMLGSTLFVVDENGEVISHTIYDPWGEPLTETYIDANFSGLDSVNNFTGYTYDEVLDLYFAQNRFYDATTHRFTQEDIVKDGSNWYVYCGNNPGIRVDVNGLRYILVDGIPVNLSDNSRASSGYIWITELVSILKLYSVDTLASVTYYPSSHRVSGTINGVYYNIRLNDLRRSGSTRSGYDAYGCFSVLFCTTNSRTYVKLTELMSFTNLSGRVMWCSTALENKITSADIKAGIRVAVINNVQYLDVTTPVTNAVKKAEPNFAAHRAIIDYKWFIEQVNNGKPWDIKLSGVWGDTIGTTFPGAYNTRVVFQGKNETPESLGNITYGYLGSAMGWSLTLLLMGGDYAAGGIKGVFTVADPYQDKTKITQGVNWYQKEHPYDLPLIVA